MGLDPGLEGACSLGLALGISLGLAPWCTFSSRPDVVVAVFAIASASLACPGGATESPSISSSGEQENKVAPRALNVAGRWEEWASRNFLTVHPHRSSLAAWLRRLLDTDHADPPSPFSSLESDVEFWFPLSIKELAKLHCEELAALQDSSWQASGITLTKNGSAQWRSTPEGSANSS